ncbi:glycine/D-amino acid oxidase-like deaminating enzyme [Tamaricihabitans halophyticus]|uniref:Glycine/D-amino acid oxidase-like deaminating enzyme n=1 Tax=Tamaricihabitans halophyticus TaxID=1262583 RepID=A0A4R2QDZ6_9PSEU|nr:FAD-binding oxidoreductase [Tamaricihabitans halophyticus]TCP47300.1 glycine/D-amino acid oxidase-like deaminating enzyme [Tamaricihabitans halophyticus]
MVDRAEIVVVGGGILGCAAALHLLHAGVRDVRVVERDGVGQATTAAGGGFLGHWAPYELESEASQYGRKFYANLHDDGHDIAYRANSMLYVAASAPAWESLSADESAGTSVLTPAEVEARTGGVVCAASVFGGLLDQSGAQVHAPKVVATLAERVRAAGGVIDTRRPVTAITVEGGRVRAVETARGRVDCEAVVLAAGAWNSELAASLGFFLPTVPQVTSRITTGPRGVPDTLPTLFLTGLASDEPDGGTILWARGHDGGLLWGGTYDVYPRDILVDTPVPERLDDLPIDGILEIMRIATRGAQVSPRLAEWTQLRIKHGAPCYTPDMRALVGEIPGITGAYVLSGDNEAGITYGPGYAKALTQRIVDGPSESAHLDAWRPDRFNDQFTTQGQLRDALAEYDWT